jgi:hypothetical protein
VLGALLLISAPALARQAHVYSSSFGSKGTGTGQFEEPTGVAINEVSLGVAGDVYVVDTANNRVERFSSNGTYLSQFTGAATPAKAFSAPSAIAIDNSTSALDPSSGDIYVQDTGNNVIDKFDPEGAYLGQITAGAEGLPFGQLDGVAVDPEGVVWVYQDSKEIDNYSNAAPNVFLASRLSQLGTNPGFAVDSEDNLYVRRGSEEVGKLNSAGEVLSEAVDGEPASAVAVDQSTNEVYLDNVTTVAAFGPTGTPIERFGFGHLTSGSGLAVDAASHLAYVADRSADAVRIFSTVLVPDVSTGEATNIAKGSVTLNGTVNPDGLPVTSCKFQYVPVAEYEAGTAEPFVKGASVDCNPQPGSGSAAVAVSARIELTPGTSYRYRLVAENANGASAGQEPALSVGAAIESESVTNVRSGEATVSAAINALGESTSYRVEYGPSTAYGSLTAGASIGAPSGKVSVLGHLAPLQPATLYHFRFVATTAFGSTFGSDQSFTTSQAQGATSASLPDHRGYELVSTSGNYGEVYVPLGPHKLTEDATTQRLFQASATGEAITYLGLPSTTGGNGGIGYGFGSQWLATRNPEGWKTNDILPVGSVEETEFEGFSTDLSTGIFRTVPRQPPLVGDTPPHCQNPYLVTGHGHYTSLFTTTNVTGSCAGIAPLFAGANEGTTSVPEFSHVLLQTTAPLLAGQQEAEEATPEGPEGAGGHGREHCEHSCNLYEFSAGSLRPVNVLPDGSVVPNAVLGGRSGSGSPPDFSHAVSNDGSRIFWSDTQQGTSETYQVFVRESGERTVQVSAGEPAQFWTASPDGRFALYTEGGRLWRFDVATEAREDLTPEGPAHEAADVQGVIGTNTVGEAGSYVYFVADGVLTGPEQNHAGAHAEAGQPNLYLLHAGATSFLATLSPQDSNLSAMDVTHPGPTGDWTPDLGSRTAQVTPDGRHLVFESEQPLTGYLSVVEGQPAAEVFVYSADDGTVSCASCNPSGASPSRSAEATGSRAHVAAFLPISESRIEMRRWISADGARVFFDSFNPLVPGDSNGLQDVYEWERPASPSEPDNSCTPASSSYSSVDGGCVSLLSGGESSDQSFLVDADANGANVFFTTRSRLVAQDEDEKTDLYDARVGGGFARTSLACTGSGCQGVPPAPPLFATPASATFGGTGNFPPPLPKAVSKPKKTSAQIRLEKLSKALKSCKKDKNKKKRSTCEKTAHKRYGRGK